MAAADRVIASRTAHIDPCAIFGTVLLGFDLRFEGIDLLAQFAFQFRSHLFELIEDVVQLTFTAQHAYTELFDFSRGFWLKLFDFFEQVVYFLNHHYCWLFFRYIYKLSENFRSSALFVG